MPRLKEAPRRIGAAPYRLKIADQPQAYVPSQPATRNAAPWKPWYGLKRWRELRMATFVRDSFTCQMCGRLEGDTSKLTCDHRRPHRGDPKLFWDEDNLQTLCTEPCHVRHKQREEQASRHQMGDWGALPGQRPPSLMPDRPTSPGAMARPSWFRRSHMPLTVVCGPPGSGKSTLVRSRAGAYDRIICFDEIATELFGAKGQARARIGLTVDQIADALRERNERIADLMRQSAKDRWPKAWLILTEPKAADRQWWADTLGAEVIVLPVPADECRRRIKADHMAGDDRGEAVLTTVDAWWRDYSPAACDRPA